MCVSVFENYLLHFVETSSYGGSKKSMQQSKIVFPKLLYLHKRGLVAHSTLGGSIIYHLLCSFNGMDILKAWLFPCLKQVLVAARMLLTSCVCVCWRPTNRLKFDDQFCYSLNTNCQWLISCYILITDHKMTASYHLLQTQPLPPASQQRKALTFTFLIVMVAFATLLTIIRFTLNPNLFGQTVVQPPKSFLVQSPFREQYFQQVRN